MNLSTNYKPVILQTYGTTARRQLDRVTALTGGTNTNKTDRKELGTDGAVGYKTGAPSISRAIEQREYGEFDIFQDLANSTATTLTHANFRTSAVDILAFQTDDDGTFIGTTWYPKCRVASFNINVPSPDDDVTRTFNLVGEDKESYYGSNAYLIELTHTIVSGEEGTYEIVIGGSGTDFANYPSPVEDPDTSGLYIQRLVRIRAGSGSDLIEGTDFTYTHGTTTISISSAQVGDTYKAVYTAASYITGSDPFTSNSVDLSGISADCVSIYLVSTSNYIYRLQSASVDVALTRFDAKEVGNSEVVQRGVRETTVTITLPRNLEDYVLDEFLIGQSGAGTYGKIDVRQYLENITFIMKVYSSATKATFKYGIRCTNMTVSTEDDNASVDNYTTKSVTLMGKDITLSTVEGTINGA